MNLQQTDREVQKDHGHGIDGVPSQEEMVMQFDYEDDAAWATGILPDPWEDRHGNEIDEFDVRRYGLDRSPRKLVTIGEIMIKQFKKDAARQRS